VVRVSRFTRKLICVFPFEPASVETSEAVDCIWRQVILSFAKGHCAGVMPSLDKNILARRGQDEFRNALDGDKAIGVTDLVVVGPPTAICGLPFFERIPKSHRIERHRTECLGFGRRGLSATFTGQR